MWLPPEEQTPEGLAEHWEQITATEGERALQAGFEQSGKMITKAAAGLGISLD
jgi:predicted metal-dependent TIM-barrel fold hydrolase